MSFDVVIVGGGPAGLSAALALGRARKRVLLCDGGPRRNAAAEHLQNFVTRDGTTPAEFRRIGREQLARYPSVEARDVRVESVSGARGAFQVALAGSVVAARRVLLCTGMVDDALPVEGFRELWGRSIFQCPYCHGWEARDERWAYLARASDAAHLEPFALMARGWTRDLVVLTSGAMEVSPETRARFAAARIQLETAPIARLVEREGARASVELVDGRRVDRDVLFAHPPQRQVALVSALGVALDDEGYVRVDPMRRETSVPGVYAAGDLTTRGQSAVFAAAAGSHAGGSINVDVSMELAATGALADRP